MSSRLPVSARNSFLALSCIGASLAPMTASAQDAPQDKPKEERALGSVTVTDTAIDDEPGRTLESPKRTSSVRDTPQTITVLTKEVIEKQNLLTLRDVLATVPGITFGAGEGGGGYGDSINFRGYSANQDITVDGVRDSAQYSRTDPFNLDQIEVTNGANSVVSGAGSVGGNINLVTKRPLARDQAIVTGGIGTDDYYRGTVDINQRVSNLIAVRLNAMVHRNDIPGRDVENYKRWGVAPSLTIGIDSPTRLTFQYLHQEDTNIPQYGVPYYVNGTVFGPVPGVDRSDYFGFRNIDTQRVNVDQATATFEHEFSEKVSIRNLTRWEDVTQFTLVDPPQGTWCLANGLTPTGGACTATIAGSTLTIPAGYAYLSGPRGTTRDTRNQLLFNQTDLKARFNTGAIEHNIDLGFAATWEKFHLVNGNSERNADGTSPFPYLPLINIDNPNDVVTGPAAATGLTRVYGSNVYTGPVNFIPSGIQEGEQTNYAAYLFDTMTMGKFQLNGGVRLERNSGRYRADTISTATATLGAVTRGQTFYNANTLFSYRIGLVYKPIDAVSLYVAYGNSQTPSKNGVNGSCTAATCNVDPESAKNYEIGAKAELLNGGLLLSVAAFRNDRDKYKVASADPTIPDQVLNGHSRVDGISLSAVGTITPAWQITANYTYLDGRLIQSVADGLPDPAANSELTQTPKHSGSLFTTYRLPFGVTIGYGATYQGSFAFNSPTAASSIIYRSKDYWVHQAYLSYDFNKRFSAQINVKNFTDTEYYTRIRNNGWATPGDGRSAMLTITAKF